MFSSSKVSNFTTRSGISSDALNLGLEHAYHAEASRESFLELFILVCGYLYFEGVNSNARSSRLTISKKKITNLDNAGNGHLQPRYNYSRVRDGTIGQALPG